MLKHKIAQPIGKFLLFLAAFQTSLVKSTILFFKLNYLNSSFCWFYFGSDTIFKVRKANPIIRIDITPQEFMGSKSYLSA